MPFRGRCSRSVVSLVGLFLRTPQWLAILFVRLYFLARLTFGSLGIFLLHNVAGGNWGVAIRRFF